MNTESVPRLSVIHIYDTCLRKHPGATLTMKPDKSFTIEDSTGTLVSCANYGADSPEIYLTYCDHLDDYVKYSLGIERALTMRAHQRLVAAGHSWRDSGPERTWSMGDGVLSLHHDGFTLLRTRDYAKAEAFIQANPWEP